MPVPSYQEFMGPLLALFGEGKTSVKDCLPALKSEFGLSDADCEELVPNGTKTVFADRVHWARTYLGKAGALTSPKRGSHVITDIGRKLLAENGKVISNEQLHPYGQFSSWIEGSKGRKNKADPEKFSPSPFPTSDLTPEQQIEDNFLIYQKSLEEELLEALYQVTPSRFEHLIVSLLNAMGFGAGRLNRSQVTSLSRDGGIDGIINEDALGLDAVYIQAKRYSPENKVSRPDIQRFVGSLTGESATKGVFVTTSDFSKEARDYILRVQHRVVLINGQQLANLMIEHNVGVNVTNSFVLKSIDEAFFSDD